MGKSVAPAVNPIDALTQIVDCVKVIQVEGKSNEKETFEETCPDSSLAAAPEHPWMSQSTHTRPPAVTRRDLLQRWPDPAMPCMILLDLASYCDFDLKQ